MHGTPAGRAQKQQHQQGSKTRILNTPPTRGGKFHAHSFARPTRHARHRHGTRNTTSRLVDNIPPHHRFGSCRQSSESSSLVAGKLCIHSPCRTAHRATGWLTKISNCFIFTNVVTSFTKCSHARFGTTVRWPRYHCCTPVGTNLPAAPTYNDAQTCFMIARTGVFPHLVCCPFPVGCSSKCLSPRGPTPTRIFTSEPRKLFLKET